MAPYPTESEDRLIARRRLIAFAAMALLAAACSGNASETTTTTSTTTTSTSTTTTTSTPTTTSGVPVVTPPPEPLATTPGTPPALFDTYSATMEIQIELGDLVVDMRSDGVWTTDAFSCTTSTDMFGLGIEEHVVVTSSQMWIDSGFGLQPASLDDPDAMASLTTCPSSPGFWEELIVPPEMDLTLSKPDEVNGIPARRINIGGAIGSARELGLPGLEGITFDTLTAWVADGVFVAFDTRATIDETLLSDMGLPSELDVGERAGMTMRFELADLNDPDLTVAIPE
jgi:hypothetical protein